MTHNLDIWNSVEKTDPTFTKGFQVGGGLKGTATNAIYLAKRATELFGPCGLGWGLRVEDEKVYESGDEKLHVVRCEFWYVLDGKRGSITAYGQTKMVTKRQSGLFLDDEAPKKSLTDAMSKGLSLLGFAADIHMGMCDDNRYVAEVKREYSEAKAEARAAGDVAPVSVPVGPRRAPEANAQALAKTREILEHTRSEADHTARNQAKAVAAAAENVVPLTTAPPKAAPAAAVDAHDLQTEQVEKIKVHISSIKTAAELKAYMTKPGVKAQMMAFGDEIYGRIRAHGLAHLDVISAAPAVSKVAAGSAAPIAGMMKRISDARKIAER